MSKKDKGKKEKSQAQAVTDNLAKAMGEMKKGKAKLVSEPVTSPHALEGENPEWSAELDRLRAEDQKVHASEKVMKVLRIQRLKKLQEGAAPESWGNTAVEVVEPEGPAKKGKKHAKVLQFPKPVPVGVPAPTAEVDVVEPVITETEERQPDDVTAGLATEYKKATAEEATGRTRTDNQLKALQTAQTTANQTGRVQDVVVTRLYRTKNFGTELVKRYQAQVPGIAVGGDEYLEEVDKWRVRLEVRPTVPSGAGSQSLFAPINVEVDAEGNPVEPKVTKPKKDKGKKSKGKK